MTFAAALVLARYVCVAFSFPAFSRRIHLLRDGASNAALSATNQRVEIPTRDVFFFFRFFFYSPFLFQVALSPFLRLLIFPSRLSFSCRLFLLVRYFSHCSPFLLLFLGFSLDVFILFRFGFQVWLDIAKRPPSFCEGGSRKK